MKVISIELSEKIKVLEIVPLSDIHLGDKNCAIDEIRKEIKYIRDNPNVYCVLNGDIIDNAIKNSVSDIYSQDMNPMEQIQFVLREFEPIKGKILAITLGNHEARTWKWDGIDITRLFCIGLGIEDRYAGESALLFIRFGGQAKNLGHKGKLWYSVYLAHGSGGGRKEGAKAIRLADMGTIVDADVYIHSHTHLPMVMKQDYFRPSASCNTVCQITRLFVNTASYIRFGGYGEALEMKPNTIQTPHIYLYERVKRAEAKL